MAWLLLAAYSEIQGDRKDLKTELLSKKKAELNDFENSLPVHIAKNENAKDTAKRPFGTLGNEYGWEPQINQPPQEKNFQFELKEKMGRNEGRLSDFIDFEG